jgi:glyoxylase-like metal-dependent hydrolase (beta-lactamase superfamily II)/rhodanese-related sulfurtransferase
MHFRQFYVGCLAHASYLIGDRGEAVVVDPSRDVEMYLEEARAHALEIKWVLETHLHADFVSGHRDLASRTGATIAIGARAGAGYPHRALQEGDVIRVGDATLTAMETPGHTPESISFLVREHGDDPSPWGVLSGDTLFVGDVGRVDILSSRLPVEALAGMMYDSLQKLLALPDETRVFPAHGAGSLCGRSIGTENWSTIGRERALNLALRPMSRDAFIAEITRDVPETPIYFLHSRDLNRRGPVPRAGAPMPPALSPAAVASAVAEGAVLLDTRSPDAFGAGHPAGALSVSLDGQYASWVGTLVHPEDTLVLVAEPGREEEAVMRLARVGYERIEGILEGGFASWEKSGGAVGHLPQISPAELTGAQQVLDVRRAREWEGGHLEGAIHVPLAELPERVGSLDRSAQWVVMCASGFRSTIAASVLERAGIPRIANLAGGMAACRKAEVEVVAA